MKVAPVSADLLIKVALAAAAAGAIYYGFKKVTGQIDSAADYLRSSLDYVTGLPGRAWESAAEYAQEGGATWQDRFTENTVSAPVNNYYGKYKDPLVNSMGYDFGQLSG